SHHGRKRCRSFQKPGDSADGEKIDAVREADQGQGTADPSKPRPPSQRAIVVLVNRGIIREIKIVRRRADHAIPGQGHLIGSRRCRQKQRRQRLLGIRGRYRRKQEDFTIGWSREQSRPAYITIGQPRGATGRSATVTAAESYAG